MVVNAIALPDRVLISFTPRIACLIVYYETGKYESSLFRRSIQSERIKSGVSKAFEERPVVYLTIPDGVYNRIIESYQSSGLRALPSAYQVLFYQEIKEAFNNL